MRFHPWSRKLARGLLLVAFVHQLGACVCGSLDHNHWYQAAVRSYWPHHTHQHSHGSHHFPKDSPTPTLIDDQAHGQLVYVEPSRITEVDQLDQVSAVPAPLLDSVQIPGVRGVATSHLIWDEVPNPSLPVRAELQIFLL